MLPVTDFSIMPWTITRRNEVWMRLWISVSDGQVHAAANNRKKIEFLPGGDFYEATVNKAATHWNTFSFFTFPHSLYFWLRSVTTVRKNQQLQLCSRMQIKHRTQARKSRRYHAPWLAMARKCRWRGEKKDPETRYKWFILELIISIHWHDKLINSWHTCVIPITIIF